MCLRWSRHPRQVVVEGIGCTSWNDTHRDLAHGFSIGVREDTSDNLVKMRLIADGTVFSHFLHETIAANNDNARNGLGI